MPEVVFSIGGESVGEVDRRQVRPGQSVQEFLKRAIGPDRMAVLPNLQNVVVTDGRISVRADLSTPMDEIDKKLGEAERILVRLNTRLEGGVAPFFTPSAWDKVIAIMGAVIRWFRDGNIEFVLLCFGPKDVPGLITEVELVVGQRVSSASFEADEDALERTMAVVRRRIPDLVLKAVCHKHPGVRSAYHSHRDDEYLTEFLKLVALLLYEMGGWSRNLEEGHIEDGAVHVPLDPDGRRTVVLTPQNVPEDDEGEAARALLDGVDYQIIGADLQAQLHSIVFCRDESRFGRSVTFRSIAALTADGEPVFAAQTIEEDLEVKVLDEEPEGVEPADIGTEDELEDQVRRRVRRFYNSYNGYPSNVAVLPAGDEADDDEVGDHGAGSYTASGSPADETASPLAKLEVAGKALALAGKALIEVTEALASGSKKRPVSRGES